MTETFPWGGSETTYFDASSNVLGKKWSDSHTYTDENGASQTSSHVSYSKADGSHIGSSWSDSYGSGSSFIVEKADDSSGTITSVADKVYFESGTSSWTNADGQTETREFTFNYAKNQDGSMGNFLGGTETVDGATITFNPDWSIAGRAKQVDANATALTQAQLDAIPDALETTLNDGLTYADAETYAWGTETTYYDSAGTVLGYSSVNTWSYDDGSGNTISGTNTNFNDANWNHLGSSWSDAYGSGSMIVTTGTDDGSGTLTGVANQKYRKEVNEFTDSNGNSETRTYYFNDDATDTGGTDANATDAENTGFGDFMAGTEVFGATTVNLGPNWTIVGETFDLTAGGATDTDLSTLPTAFTSTFVDGSGNAITSGVKEMTETFPWGGSETTYFDASSNVLGKKWSELTHLHR